jgi:predicted HAD superfamily Cof-like phosphohydrolase
MMKRSEIEAELARPCAYENTSDGNYSAMDGVDRTRAFHYAMGLPVRTEPAIPSVSERILRARLLMEETLETIQKGLGITITVQPAAIQDERDVKVMNGGDDFDWGCLVMTHEEGHKYDPIETLDGLADVKVIANGTAVQFGLPLHEAEYEVWHSNMSKLDENGKPIVNRCTRIGCETICDCGMELLIDPTKPIGKLLKPDTYVPANIVRIFVRFAGDEDENLNRAWLLGHGEPAHDA